MRSLQEYAANKKVNEIIPNMESTIKIKLISKKEKNIAYDSISFFKKGSNEFKQENKIKESNTSLITIEEISNDLNEKQNKIIIPPNTQPSTCVSKVSNFEDLTFTSSTLCSQTALNIDSNISLISLSNKSIFPEVEYSPVPEKEYYDDILQELLLEEKNLEEYKECLYIKYQDNMDNHKRAKMIGFIYKMAKLFRFKNRTIFLSVQTMDRFFCKQKINKYYYPLLCMCALVVSSKFNEIYYPSYKDMISYFGKDYQYTVELALKMETLILKSLDYNLIPTFPMCFFDIIAQKTNLTDIEYYLGNLMLELIQFDFVFYPVENSVLAQTVFGKVMNLTRGKEYDSIKVLKGIFPEGNFNNNDNIILMKEISNFINNLLQNLKCEYFKDIYEKYSRPEILGESINYFLKE